MSFGRFRWKLDRLRRQIREMVDGLSALGERRPAVCPRCGKLVGVSARSCPECGARVRGVASLPVHLTRLLPASVIHRILLANVTLYLLAMIGTGMEAGPGRPAGLGLGVSPRVLVTLGAGFWPLVQQGEIWRVLTPIFLHWNLPHILFNSLALLYLCPDVEEISGRGKFLTFYILAGVMGNLASFWYRGSFGLLAGASGAIFGMLGVLIVFGLRRGGSLGGMVWRMAAQWAVYALLFALVVGADNAAHLGGLVGGALLAFCFGPERSRSAWGERVWTLVGRGCVFMAILSFAGVLLAAL